MEKSKAKSTNQVTEQWTNCFSEYLKQNNHPNLQLVATEDLSQILCDFCPLLKKVCTSKPKQNLATVQNANAQDEEEEEYHNTILKCMRVALNRFFKVTRGFDIILNDKFIPANDIFKTPQYIGKKKAEARQRVRNQYQMKILRSLVNTSKEIY